MMRSLWSAASGMKSQQLYVDSISNNLANVNSTAYKKEDIEFKSLFYSMLRKGNIDEEGNGSPVNLQVGHGVMPSANVKNFSTGNIEITENPLDFAINGSGFFIALDSNGNPTYTKTGSFKISVDGDTINLVTTDGYKILDVDGDPIEFDGSFLADNLFVDELGNLSYKNNEGEIEELDTQLAVVQFRNPAGLEATGGGYFKETSASGEALLEAEEDDLISSKVIQRALESSNVQIAEEMVKMIVAQRAYELNSKAIQTSDDMLGIANSLKR